MSKETIPQSIIDKINEKNPYHPTVSKSYYDEWHRAIIWGAFELDKWISVKDGLPDEGERVLAYAAETGSYYYVAYLNVKRTWKDLGGFDVYGITHYQYLPKPPKNI